MDKKGETLNTAWWMGWRNDMEVIEVKVGEDYAVNKRVKVKCVDNGKKGYSCKECCFLLDERKCFMFNCDGGRRTDGRFVHFEKIEKERKDV